MTNQSSPEYSSLLILQIYTFFATVSKCWKNKLGILQDVLVCCLCVITFVPEIIRRVTFGQPLWIMVVFVVFVFFNSSWLLIIVNRGGKFLKKLWCCLGRRVYLRVDNLVLSIELIRFKKMTFWVLALHQSNWAVKQIVSFSTHHDSKFTLSINSADKWAWKSVLDHFYLINVKMWH